MGILQEYKFFLIIAIIALVAIIRIFFTTQTSQEYVNFTTNLQASFAQIKGVASDTKTVKDVLTVDGTNVKGLKNNSLFGLTLDGTASAIKIADEYTGSTTFPGIQPTVADGKFAITLATKSAFPEGNNGAIDAYALSSVGSGSGSITKGWDLDENGYIIYTFNSPTVAKSIIDDFLPEGTLTGIGPDMNSVVGIGPDMNSVVVKMMK